MPIIHAEKLYAVCQSILRAVGVPEDVVSDVSKSIVKADLRGIDSHGITRLPAYVTRIQKGLINLDPKLEYNFESESSMRVDGDNGLGQVVACKVIDRAIEKARKAGSCMALIHNTNYIGALTYYALRIAEQNMIGLLMCNTPPAVAPTGGKEARFGTNPICCSVPTGRGFDIVLDMAISTVALGKIRIALKKGEKIPDNWAIDAEGLPTTDPQAALQGTNLPMGGPKGYGLGMIVDILSGVLSGANYGTKIPHPLFDYSTTPNLGNFIFVINIESFIPLQFFKDRVDDYIEQLKGCKLAKGASEIFVPGEIEYRKEQQRLKEGIPLLDETWKEIEKVCRDLKVEL